MKRGVKLKVFTFAVALLIGIASIACVAVSVCRMNDAVNKTDDLFLESYGKMASVLFEDFESKSSEELLDAYARLRSYVSISQNLKQHSSYAADENINRVFVILANHNKPKERLPEDVYMILLEQLDNMDSAEACEKAATVLGEYFNGKD